MTRSRPRLFTLAPLALLAGLTACSSQPAVCDDMDALRQSVTNLRDTSVAKDGVDAVRSDLQEMGDNLDQLAGDASSEYAPQITAVKSRASELRASLDSAKATPSAQSLSQIEGGVEALTTAVDGLGTAVSSTCD